MTHVLGLRESGICPSKSEPFQLVLGDEESKATPDASKSMLEGSEVERMECIESAMRKAKQSLLGWEGFGSLLQRAVGGFEEFPPTPFLNVSNL